MSTIRLPIADLEGMVDRSRVQELPPELGVGIPEIAAVLGVERQTVDVWRWRGWFPDPEVTSIGGRPWWSWGRVRTWAIESGRMFEEPNGKLIVPPPRGEAVPV